MRLPPSVMVHSLAQARAALAPGLPVTLLSAPGAALFAGVGWWRALVEAATEHAPGHTQGHAQGHANVPPDIMDCADAPGRALEALRLGQRLLVLQSPAHFADIAERAARQGATVLDAAPPSLNLAIRGAERRLGGWLSAHN
jgi:hypothetical protein